jgi:hypothetical protein
MSMKTSRLLALFLVLSAASGARAARAQVAAPPAPAPAPGQALGKTKAISAPGGAAAGGASTGGSDAPGPGGPADASPKVKVERGAGGHKVYRITEEIRIEGKIQKPEAFFFYQKSSINYDWQELKQDFIPKILDSVSRAPF